MNTVLTFPQNFKFYVSTFKTILRVSNLLFEIFDYLNQPYTASFEKTGEKMPVKSDRKPRCSRGTARWDSAVQSRRALGLIRALQNNTKDLQKNPKGTHCKGGDWKAGLKRSRSVPDLGLSEAEHLAFSYYILQAGMQKFGGLVTELGQHKLPRYLYGYKDTEQKAGFNGLQEDHLFNNVFSNKAWMNIYSLSTRIKHFLVMRHFLIFSKGKGLVLIFLMSHHHLTLNSKVIISPGSSPQTGCIDSHSTKRL